jgi:peroxiredoxin
MRTDVGSRLVRIAAAAALAAALVAGRAAAAEPVKAKFEPGQKAPDFVLSDLAGKQVRLSDHAGKDVVLLVFWALRCGTCRAETPHIERLHRQYKGKGLAVISVDTDGIDAKGTAEIMKEIGIEVTYPVLVDPDFTASDLYTNFVVPLTYVIGRDGVIRYVHTGFESGTEKTYEEAILKALGK